MLRLGTEVGIYRLVAASALGGTLWLRGPIPLECPPFSMMHVVPPGLPHCLCERLCVEAEPA